MDESLYSAIQPPLATADLPGVGGRLKLTPEDFEVEEIPAYEPCGTGDHLYLWLEKRGMGAEYFARQIAQRLGIATGDVGTAGLKDRHAVTRQWVSVPASAEANLPKLEGDGIRVLRVSRHGNKLKPGHLRGNCFRIVIRDLDLLADLAGTVAEVVQRLRDQGVPNFYGPQRFGRNGSTLRIGLAMLRGEPPPVSEDGRRPNLFNPFLRKIALSAVQSAVFNLYLSHRLNDGLLHRVLTGDVMSKWPAGGLFVAEDVAAEQTRFDRREIVSAGPIVGRKTFAAQGEAAAREAALLAEVGLDATHLARGGKLLAGTRRHNLIYVDDLAAEVRPDGVYLAFTLPAGSYATALVREIMKTQLLEDEAPSMEWRS